MRCLRIVPLIVSAWLASPVIALGANAGDIVFTEMLIASGTGEAREWIEVFNTTGAAVDITGCELSDETGSTTLGALVVQPQTYAILSKTSTCVVYDDVGTCVRNADLTYSGITLNNGTDSATLTCAGTLIDTVSYDWDDLEDDCLAPGDGHCTANLKAAAQDATSNDVWPDNWCVPPVDQVTYDANGEVVLATPGEVGVCPVSGPTPEPGDVIFTEFMIDPPSVSREWIEIYNTTGVAVDITGCELSDETSSTTLGTLVVQAQTYAILSKTSTCVVYDDLGACVLDASLTYSGISLNNTTDSVTLTCDSTLIDTVSYDWADLEDDCLAPSGGGCTANLRAAAQDASSNDLWLDNWCVPPESEVTYDANGDVVLATPAAAGVCPKSGPSCGAGDVIFTELMIDPPSSSREWFEMKVLTGSGCDLHGCEIWEGTWESPGDDDDSAGDDDDSAGDDDDGPEGDWTIHTINAAGDNLFVGVGEYALFSKTHAMVVGEEGEEGAIPADYVYSSFSLLNDDPLLMRLVCDGVEIDAVPYDWATFEGGCPEGGCSTNLRAEAEDDLLNDDLANWCLPPLEPEYLSSDGLPFIGTPGQPGACLEREWPSEGEVLISEIMVQAVGQPAGTPNHVPDAPEWFELVNKADRDVDLGGCEMRRVRLDVPGGTEDPSTLQTHLLGSFGEPPEMPVDSVRVFSKSSASSPECLDGTEPSGTGTCLWGDEIQYTYASLSFTNGSTSDPAAERVSLYCPVVGSVTMALIDAIEYDAARTGNRSGHSLEFDVSLSDAASLNDDAYAWCEASFFDCVPELVNEDGECNYGTPGTTGPCATGQVTVPDSGPGCICDTVSGLGRDSRGGVGLLLLGLIFGVVRRRVR